mgnify:CR=1 FL=1
MATISETSRRSGIFEGDDPFALARAWLAEAEGSEPNDANAMALATVDETGMPNSRMVLLKEIEDDGFVFYTNYGSAKDSDHWKWGHAFERFPVDLQSLAVMAQIGYQAAPVIDSDGQSEVLRNSSRDGA